MGAQSPVFFFSPLPSLFFLRPRVACPVFGLGRIAYAGPYYANSELRRITDPFSRSAITNNSSSNNNSNNENGNDTDKDGAKDNDNDSGNGLRK